TARLHVHARLQRRRSTRLDPRIRHVNGRRALLMARSYAQIYLTIWNDPDFRDVSTDAQWLYFTMLTHPTLTSCGVLEWREARLTAMNADMTIPRLQNAAWELGQKRLIVVDPETEEGLVRSFVRHDGILKSPNKTKALVREHAAIASLKIMEFVSV